MNSTEGGHVDDQAAGVLRVVSVRPAQTTSDDSTSEVQRLVRVVVCDAGDGLCDRLYIRSRNDMRGSSGCATPTAEDGGRSGWQIGGVVGHEIRGYLFADQLV